MSKKPCPNCEHSRHTFLRCEGSADCKCGDNFAETDLTEFQKGMLQASFIARGFTDGSINGQRLAKRISDAINTRAMRKP